MRGQGRAGRGGIGHQQGRTTKGPDTWQGRLEAQAGQGGAPRQELADCS